MAQCKWDVHYCIKHMKDRYKASICLIKPSIPDSAVDIWIKCKGVEVGVVDGCAALVPEKQAKFLRNMKHQKSCHELSPCTGDGSYGLYKN